MRRLFALGALGVLLLTGCSAPAEDTRVERAAVAMHLLHAETGSELIADHFQEDGFYASMAEDLVEICDDGSASPYAYIAGFDDAAMEPVILAGWDIACPSEG